jgi:hypothetical protein
LTIALKAIGSSPTRAGERSDLGGVSILAGGFPGLGPPILQAVGRSSQADGLTADRAPGAPRPERDADTSAASAADQDVAHSAAQCAGALGERTRWIGSTPERHALGDQTHALTFCYVGPSQADSANPAVIDPVLEIAESGVADPRSCPAEFTPYRALSPAARRDFIAWSAGGRQSTNAPRAFLLLFVSGLEHAIFRDNQRGDLQAIRHELHRLVELHQGDAVFCRVARQLMLACALLDPGFVPDPITSSVDPNFRDEMPLEVRLFLGWMFRTAGRLEADAGLLFYLQQPRMRLEPTTAQYFREIRELWCHRYPHVAIDSFSALAQAPRLTMRYQPICGTFDCTCASDLPDVGSIAVPECLHQLYRDCTGAVADLPGEPGRLLPNAQVFQVARRASSAPQAILNGEAASRLDAVVEGNSPSVIGVGELLDMLLDAPPAKANKIISSKLADQLTEFLDEHGFGFEPDPRFHLPSLLRPDARIAMFRQEIVPFEEPIDAHLLAQAAVLLSSLGHSWYPSLQPLDLRCIEERLPYLHRFTERDFRRLEATRLAVASAEQKRKFLERWVKILCRERRLDDLVRGFGIAFKGQCRNGHLPKYARAISISCTGAIDADRLLDEAAAKPAASPYENLDGRAQALAEVQAPESSIAEFGAEPAEIGVAPAAAIDVEGLDVRHAGLLVALHERARTQAEFEELARSRRLSSAGAVDRINEWALLTLGFAAIVEGDDYTLSFEAAAHLTSLMEGR